MQLLCVCVIQMTCKGTDIYHGTMQIKQRHPQPQTAHNQLALGCFLLAAFSVGIVRLWTGIQVVGKKLSHTQAAWWWWCVLRAVSPQGISFLFLHQWSM